MHLTAGLVIGSFGLALLAVRLVRLSQRSVRLGPLNDMLLRLLRDGHHERAMRLAALLGRKPYGAGLRAALPLLKRPGATAAQLNEAFAAAHGEALRRDRTVLRLLALGVIPAVGGAFVGSVKNNLGALVVAAIALPVALLGRRLQRALFEAEPTRFAALAEAALRRDAAASEG